MSAFASALIDLAAQLAPLPRAASTRPAATAAARRRRPAGREQKDPDR
jgi:hypothetical protein